MCGDLCAVTEDYRLICLFIQVTESVWYPPQKGCNQVVRKQVMPYSKQSIPFEKEIQ
jgi:hypothetical protein